MKALTCLMLSCLLASLGCGEQAEITQYEIETRPPAQLVSEKRLLGAIIPHGERAWFVKLLGDSDQVDKVAGDVRAWVEAIKFAGDDLDLEELPGGWRQVPASSMRFATLEVPSEPLPLEISVSFLTTSGDWKDYVSQNVNRWRDQVGLASLDTEYAGAEVLSSPAGLEGAPAVWVDLAGMPKEGSGMGPMDMASMGGGPVASPPAAAESPIAYEVPEGWSELPGGGMRLAAFDLPSESGAAQLTVIAAGGDLQGNVERWIGQVRATPPNADVVAEVMAAGETVTVDGREAQRFKIKGDGEAPQAIDGTVIPLTDDFQLFVKATGDAATVAAQAEKIGQFLNTLKIK